METSERQLRSVEGATSRLTIADNQPVAAIRRVAGQDSIVVNLPRRSDHRHCWQHRKQPVGTVADSSRI